MIVLDANVLIYAYDASAPKHMSAKRWLESALDGETTVGIPLQSAAAFLRIMTEPALHDRALSMIRAIHIVQSWLALPNVRLLPQGERHWKLLIELLTRHSITGRRVSDAQIAATTLEFGGRLMSADRDFRRFPELIVENPIDGPA